MTPLKQDNELIMEVLQDYQLKLNQVNLTELDFLDAIYAMNELTKSFRTELLELVDK